MSELLKVNVNDHTEKKNGLTYLSWAWAWAEVLKVDPEAEWDPFEWVIDGKPMFFLPQPDGTAMVKVTVMIKYKKKIAILPVMNHRNQAIENPNSFQVNTAIQRCLAKAIAMHGLGLYIYAGEDLPEGEDDGITRRRKDELEEAALIMLDHQANGEELKAADLYYGLPNNEEKLYVWGLLKGPGGGSTPESRLRAFIKSNKPEVQHASL